MFLCLIEGLPIFKFLGLDTCRIWIRISKILVPNMNYFNLDPQHWLRGFDFFYMQIKKQFSHYDKTSFLNLTHGISFH